MHHISKSAIVPYSCEQMYQLVNQIDKYPQFLNWCSSADILNQTEQEITASVSINKNTFKQTFTTLNTLTPNVRIDMQLKDGPFKQLNGAWIFTSLNDNACKINLELEFSFASKLVDMVIAPVFTSISNTQLDAFIERAKQIYG
ncbi:Putative oligoketide cyclase/lipid transport protein, similarity with yeast ubiquinone-binding protein YOL008W [uncultured Gammaproteobacteria bacterium]|uniref:type II toxin-antitoxin system RatA family toxin n=1 Tax=thiotrophic endosymbiont of Bathymodiolus puteoserpentis (Logatchev) TaxID=343240 RepID=UPI0010B998DC|nr:type II toxin-antitoxin system RatA family toxin [thiotrophic endosymbiont of Bathymodiolus puteoserpentis (Logatchev)]SSC10304.1 Putative oligoketide cyclase/lipid transport protein, similarity with yeast ubiquinone-binding protein YOL008W [thiotrophic endosymbiont of Bathymodiolus puteoserpentis (Logatchev)]VVH52467.1 Putative oligoketide cyclase/lipid transport protein, similarity with yeast ubiquinone-binding protein YOL008W [uncultured Gammaproteobacteria bacterium]